MELEVWKGMVSSDDFYTGSRAGLKGGITSFWGFAYQKKNETLLRAYRRTYKSASKKSVSNFYLHAGILNTNTDYEKQIRECIKNNIRTFKVHLNDPKVDTVFLMKIFQLVSRYNGILLLHCEDGKIAEYNKEREAKSRQAIEQLNDKQLIASCHDLSHGGFITALVEMLIPKRIGATISLDKMPSVTNIQTEELLFAETPARYLVEVKPTHIQEVKELLDKIGVPYGFIGKTIKESLLKIEGVTTISINEILEAWRGTLPLYMEV